MKSKDNFLMRLAALTAAAALLVMLWQSWPLIQAGLLAPGAEPRLVTPRGDLAVDEQDTIALFEAARPAVVYIETTAQAVDPWTRNPLQVPRGTGTGFVWDRLGHVVTNQHVIAGASAATVRLADGRAFPAGLVGMSAAHDLAVLRIGSGAATPAPLPIGTSRDLSVGQKTFAIGNPFGLDWTLTTGIVSALNRELPTDQGGVLDGLIQTDAAINPGNSGGPLLDSAGRVIGVNTAIFSPSGAYAGIGFAVPVDTVNRVVPRLIAQGRFVGASLGVRSEPQVNAALSRRLGIEGVFVLAVEPGSAAARAGIRPGRMTRDGGFIPGDVLLSLGARQLAEVRDLTAVLDALDPGADVPVTLLRDGRRVEIAVTLDAAR